MKNKSKTVQRRRRTAAIALAMLVFLLALLGLIALAVDVGYIMVTKTHLQAAVDSATLSGGTELRFGLGLDPVTPATVKSKARSVAVDYGSKNRNGDQKSSYLNPTRDVIFGWARFNTATNQWETHEGEQLPDVGGYNMIRAIIRRDQGGSTNDDVPLPLFFANALGHDTADLAVDATAVIMPANGFRIVPGSPTKANVLPFAIRRVLWEKYLRAQAHFDAFGFPNPLEDTLDAVTGEPLFGHIVQDQQGNDVFVQDFFDDYTCSCAADDTESSVSAGGDTILELDIYPRDDYTSGNLGTIDIGSDSNSTSDVERQITEGANDEDLSHYTNNELTLPHSAPGDTGVSAGIKDELDAIVGQCRAMFLFDGVANTGNTTTFDLADLVGVRLMHSELTGSLEFKHLALQRCDATLTGSVPDLDETIDKNTTVFTPLILIE